MSKMTYRGAVWEETIEVKDDSISLTIPCYQENCQCYTERVIFASVPNFRTAIHDFYDRENCYESRRENGKHYNIFVPACVAHISRSPILSACDFLEETTGYEIIRSVEAERIIKDYSYRTIHNFKQDVPPVIHGAYNNEYYLKREVFEYCLHYEQKKCEWCAKRHCKNRECEELSWDLKNISREYGDSFVYFLLHPANGQVKIGYSREPIKRVKAHRASNAGEIVCLGVIYGSKNLEGYIHDDLQFYRTAGKKEWFYYTENVKKYIDMIIKNVKNYERTDKIREAETWNGFYIQ